MARNLTDTHCHLDDDRYNEDLEAVIKRAEDLNFILNPGCDIETSQKAIEISENFPKVYAAVGIHPNDLENYNKEADIEMLRKLAKNKNVLAIGEIGLDYYYDDNPPREVQMEAFEDQIKLAKELDLPFIVHDREAHEDTMTILRKYPEVRCVVHSFSGDSEMAKEVIDLGNFISIGGPLTFKNSGNLPKVIEEIPLEKIMLETDGPYLTPVPFRGKRNEPTYVRYVAQKIAELKGITVEEVEKQTQENAKIFFNKDF